MSDEQNISEERSSSPEVKKSFSLHSIIFLIGALLISGAIVFASNQYFHITDEELDKRIDQGIDRFVKKEQEAMAEEQKKANNIAKVTGVDVDDDPIIGDPDAPVTIVEFSDYLCPYCKRHFLQTYPQLKEQYIDTGKVKLVFRDFPLPSHDPEATQRAIAAECVRKQIGDGGYFQAHDILFNSQGATDFTVDDLVSELKLKKGSFDTCMADPTQLEEVKKDIQDGSRYGVTGTPSFFVNGWFFRGAYPYEIFQQYIEIELQTGQQ